MDPGKRARLEFSNYLQPGNKLSLEIDLANNNILNLQESTYIAKPEDVVGLNVYFSTLNDGSTYASKINLVAKAKQMTVDVENSGYLKM